MAILSYNEHTIHWANVTLENYPLHVEALNRALKGDLDLISRIDNQSAQTKAVWILTKDRILKLLSIRQALRSSLQDTKKAENKFSALFQEIMQIRHPEWNPIPQKS